MSQHLVLDAINDPRLATGLGGLFFGVYPAIVTELSDPDGVGAVRVRLPWAPDAHGGEYEAQARIATLMSGADRGTWFIPDVDDEVLVAFEGGDPSRPYVLGGLWNGSDTPPETLQAANDVKTIKSRSGVKITISDQAGSSSITIETPGGHEIKLDDGGMAVTVRDSNGNSATLDASGISLTSSAKVSVQASSVEVSAGSVTVNAGMSTFSGVVKADTVIATSVVGSTYTPGAGNIW